MTEAPPMFSESWHHVARERIALRASVQIRRQSFRGERWYVLHDPFSNRFFRLTPGAYRFVCRLGPDRTVEDVWRESLERDPDAAPSQGEVIQLLSQLYQSSLIQSEISPDSARLFERQRKQRAKEIRGRLASILFIRIPLWDPEAFLKKAYPFVRFAFGKAMLLIWLLVVGYGMKIAADNWEAAWDRRQELLAPGNLPLLLATFVVIKLIHEFGHAFACKHYGGEVHTMGVMLLVFSPVPYVDATAAWAFRERYKRVFVGAAGMVVEIFFAAIAAVVWANTGEGTVHAIAYNAMVIASVTTILFNINPLLRFDGYYILSDLTETPNLQMRSGKQLAFLAEKYLFAVPQAESPARSRSEAWFLAIFGVTSWIYRLFIFSAIILFIADRFFGLGFIAAVIAFFGLFILPLGKYANYLATSPRLNRTRPRAVAITAAAAAALAVLLGVVPFPNHFRAPGVLRAIDRQQIAAGASGRVTAIAAGSASQVRRGDLLIQMESPEIEFSLRSADAQMEQVGALESLALVTAPASIKPVAERKKAVAEQIKKLRADRAALAARAEMDGIWVSPRQAEYRGVWVDKGSPLGEVVDPSKFEFAAVVDQDDAGFFFSGDGGGAPLVRGAEIRLPGEAGRTLPVAAFRIVPAQQEALPSAALGWMGGGPIEVAATDSSGVRAAEPFFLVIADVAVAA
ncbi:MAG: hypothetical protein R3F11_24780 [Verrucomicrobiales bacterium]